MKAIVKTLISIGGIVGEAALITRGIEFREKCNEEREILDQYSRVKMLELDKELMEIEGKDTSHHLWLIEFTMLAQKFYYYKKTRWLAAFGWLPLNKGMKEVQEYLKNSKGRE